MARPPAPLPVSLRNRPFTVEEALTAKVSKRRLRAADLRSPYRGVRVSKGLAWTPALRARCALLASPEKAVVVGEYAVAVWELPTPFGAKDPMSAAPVVAVPAGTRRPRCPDLAVRAVSLHPSSTFWKVSGVLVPGVEDLWAERCGALDLESAVALGDAALRRLQGRRGRLLAALERLPVEEQPTAREVLALVRFEVCSPVETRVRFLVRRAGIPEASHYATPIPREGPAEVWPDLQWESVKVAVEIDGPHHRAGEQHERDVRRDRRTSKHGWTQVKFTTREVMNEPDMVVRVISEELRTAGLRW